MNKNEMGLIILDDLNRLDKIEAGRKKKVWLEKDNKETYLRLEHQIMRFSLR